MHSKTAIHQEDPQLPNHPYSKKNNSQLSILNSQFSILDSRFEIHSISAQPRSFVIEFVIEFVICHLSLKQSHPRPRANPPLGWIFVDTIERTLERIVWISCVCTKVV
jgi:hypothetical protein